MLGGEYVYQEEEEVNDMSFFQQDPYDDEDETLSFCDLPIYGDVDNESADASSSSRWNQQSPSSSSSFSSCIINGDEENDDECFEFSFSSSSCHSQQETSWGVVGPHDENKNIIIFCGKIIPTRKQEEPPKLQQPFIIKGRRKSRSSTPPPLTEKRCHATPSYNKTSSSSSSSKWYNLLMFGLVRIQGHMELKDIKKRQIKRIISRRRSTTFCKEEEQGHQIVNKSAATGDHDEMIKGKGLLSFLRAFSCITPSDDDHHVDYCRKVKASLWCVQQLRPPH